MIPVLPGWSLEVRCRVIVCFHLNKVDTGYRDYWLSYHRHKTTRCSLDVHHHQCHSSLKNASHSDHLNDRNRSVESVLRTDPSIHGELLLPEQR